LGRRDWCARKEKQDDDGDHTGEPSNESRSKDCRVAPVRAGNCRTLAPDVWSHVFSSVRPAVSYLTHQSQG
jgi:hypothetical protein